MYIIDQNGAFSVSDGVEGAVAEILPPVCIENGVEREIPFLCRSGDRWIYQDAENRVTLSMEQKGNTLFYLRREWENRLERTRELQLVLRVEALFEVAKYLIPCVTVNGNEFGAGGEPKGLERDGKKWIFGYDRVSIPACTLTENAQTALALFASAEDGCSLRSSCSITRNPNTGRYRQELLHPVIEAPVTYCSRDRYSEPVEAFLTVGAGESFSCGMYLSVSHPRWENFGICDAMDSALEIFGSEQGISVPERRAIWDRSITFAKGLISDYKGKKGFIIGYCLNEKGEFVYRGDQCFELAWCGQNVLFSRMLVEDYLLTGNRESLDTAIEILDTRVETCTAKSGLISSQLKNFERLDETSSDTCNMGYGAYELLRVYARLKEIGIEKPAYLETARGVCDFFCEHFTEDRGFGKQWRHDGVCLDGGGTIGAFLIAPMERLYAITGEEKYLQMAERAMEYYVKRDLDQFTCTAGAIDTCCVDKETSFPLLLGGILLYEQTGKRIYLEYAEKAAYYFTSWMFHYQPLYPEDSDLSRFGVCVKGLTSVSAQHHHLDMYAGITVPYLRRLAEYLGSEAWRARAEMMWNAVLQFIGDGELTVHGKLRPIGSQNEALFHCNWSFGEYQRGDLNDWLVAWPCAFRLSVLADERSKGEGKL